MNKLTLIGLAVVFTGFLLLRTASGATVSAPAARTLVEQQGALLLDVRTREEFAAGHLDGALNIPVQELDARLAELPGGKQRPIVVYCRSGARSAKAAKLLSGAGWAHVHDLGGMPGSW